MGTSEAAYCGVPVISTPFYGDQFLNSAAAEKRGMGVVLKYQDINKDSVFYALRKTLEPAMKENARKVSYSFSHRPMTPKEAAVYWAEYVIATGGAELVKPHTVDAHWLVYSSLDIYLFLLAVIGATIANWIYFLRKIFKKSVDKSINPPLSHRGVSIDRKTK